MEGYAVDMRRDPDVLPLHERWGAGIAPSDLQQRHVSLFLSQRVHGASPFYRFGC